MRFLVDAQLPVRLARFMSTAGHDVIHTSELPDGNRTSDIEIARRSDAEDRVVVTKDRDFRDHHLLRTVPRRLLIVAAANTGNNELIALFEKHLDAIVAALDEVRFVELGPAKLIIHADR
ncbi:MAG: DUF5615 family PIN-like protein [Acidimicrobiales bacterium]